MTKRGAEVARRRRRTRRRGRRWRRGATSTCASPLPVPGPGARGARRRRRPPVAPAAGRHRGGAVGRSRRRRRAISSTSGRRISRRRTISHDGADGGGLVAGRKADRDGAAAPGRPQRATELGVVPEVGRSETRRLGLRTCHGGRSGDMSAMFARNCFDGRRPAQLSWSSTHPERSRDGPVDAAATSARHESGASKRPGANARPMRRRSVVHRRTRLSGVRGHVPGGGAPRLRVVLRAARGRLRLRRPSRAAITRETIAAGPADASGATPTCCRPTPGRGRPRRRASRRWCGPTAWRPSSASASCGSRTTPLNPTGSFKDRVVVGRAGQGAASSASRSRPARPPATWPTRSPPTPPGPGMRRYVFIPPTSRPARSSRTAVYGGNARRGRRQLRRRQPPLRRAGGRASDVGLRQRQPAAVLRRGLQDPRLRDRRAARLAGARPRRRARSPSGSQLTKIAKGFQELAKVGLLDEPARGAGVGGPGARAARPSPPRSPRAPTRAAGEARHDRQVAGHRQPGRRVLRARRGPRRPAARSRR